MSSLFGTESFDSSTRAVSVDAYTSALRISGSIQTRFTRVSDIVNLQSGTHLTIEKATVSDYADPSATLSAPRSLVAIDAILMLIASDDSGDDSGGAPSDMRIEKRPVKAQLAIPPFRLTGTIHVPQGSRPIDGLLNLQERFMPMTDVAIACGAHPELARQVPALAMRRDRAHVMVVADDERPDELLADLLDERTAAAWLRSAEGEGG
jgi:hypothetical protein